MPTYIHHFVLDDVADVFDASALWQAAGLPLFARKLHLRDLLERHPRQQKGRTLQSCFSHVRLLLPSAQLDDDDHLFRASHKHELIAALTAMHQSDFANLLDGQEVRYQVQADDSLLPTQVGVQFGHALYIAAAHEPAQYQLQYSLDSVLWQDVGTLYQQQRLCLLGADSQQHSLSVPNWPASLAGALLLINDGPGCSLQLRARPAAAFDLRFDANAGYYVLAAQGNRAGVAAGQNRRLLLKVIARESVASPKTSNKTDMKVSAPAIAEKARSAQVWQARPLPAAGKSVSNRAAPIPPSTVKAAMNTAAAMASTAYPQARPAQESELTYVPIATKRSRINLVALALPRLSRYPQAGVSQLSFGFAPDMRLQAGAKASTAMLNFSVDAQDQIHVATAAGQQKLAAPMHFEPIAGQHLDLLPVALAMQELYAACLRLPAHACKQAALQATIPAEGRISFGRNAPQLAHLRVLDQAAISTEGQVFANSADRIGLSRLAFSVAVAGADFHIWRESQGQVLFHLDEKLQLVQAIEEAQYLLPNGHHVVAGHYVLQLQNG